MSLSKKQLALRQQALGASEIATVVGVGGGSLVELFETKVLGPRPEDVTDDGLARRLGTGLEQSTADEYALRTGSFLASTYTLRHPEHPLIIATPDRVRFSTHEAMKAAVDDAFLRPNPYDLDGPEFGLLDAEGVLRSERAVECKTTAGRNERGYGPEGSGVVPEEKAIQGIIQMAVTGLRVVDLPVLFLGDFGHKFKIFTIGWNEELAHVLIDAAERFWVDHVKPKKPPPPDGSDRYDEFLARAFPTHGAKPKVADEDEEALMLKYAQVHTAFKRIEKLKKKVRQELVTAIGEADGMISAAYGKVTYRRTADKSEIDWSVAAQDALMLAGQCLGAFDVLAKTGEAITPENRAKLVYRLKNIIPEATRPRPGFRRLVPKWSGEADYALKMLELKLDSLEAGEPAGGDE